MVNFFYHTLSMKMMNVRINLQKQNLINFVFFKKSFMKVFKIKNYLYANLYKNGYNLSFLNLKKKKSIPYFIKDKKFTPLFKKFFIPFFAFKNCVTKYRIHRLKRKKYLEYFSKFLKHTFLIKLLKDKSSKKKKTRILNKLDNSYVKFNHLFFKYKNKLPIINYFFFLSSDTQCLPLCLKMFFVNSSLNIVIYFNRFSTYLRMLRKYGSLNMFFSPAVNVFFFQKGILKFINRNNLKSINKKIYKNKYLKKRYFV